MELKCSFISILALRTDDTRCF